MKRHDAFIDPERFAAWITNVVREREAQGMTTHALAKAAGVDGASLWRFERGQKGLGPRLQLRIAQALGLKTAELFPRDPAEDRLSEARAKKREAA